MPSSRLRYKPAYAKKKLVVFDLDGTLSPTKSPVDPEMMELLIRLLRIKRVAVIGGGKYALFREQLIRPFNGPKELLKNLFLFPTTSTSFYRYDSGWKNVYTLELSAKERAQIKKAFQEVFEEIGYVHPKTYGRVIEDRGTQVTFSALGQDVVRVLGTKKGVALKDKWRDENTDLKIKMAKLVQKKLPKLEVRAAGHTSIDVTRRGIDKAYGLKQIEKYLKVPIREMVFVGDALFPNGNDYAALKTGVDAVAVADAEETKKVVRMILRGSGG